MPKLQTLARRSICNFAAPRFAKKIVESKIVYPSVASSIVSTPARFFASHAATTQGNVGDIITFPLADIGEGITECELIQWFVKEGQEVKQFDKICEVQSDKANVEITSRYDGIIDKIMYAQGETAHVGKPLVHIKLTKATAGVVTVGSDASAKSAPAPEKPAPTASGDSTNVLASPVVRRMARENGIDLGSVAGTGSKGQITKEDLEKFMASSSNSFTSASQPSTPAPTPTSGSISVPAGSTPCPLFIKSSQHDAPEDKKIVVSGIQKAMVKSMTASLSVPTLGLGEEINVDRLIKIRAMIKDTATKHGIKLTYLPFIIKAISLSLTEYPAVNSIVNSDCSEITIRGSHNIGVAMDTPKGLLVPNIKNVQNLSLFEISAELNRLQTLAAAGKLGTADLAGATFTISNIGSIGGTYCNPVIVVPQVMIGAIGRFNQTTVWKNGTPHPSTVMNMSWTADHRALDGATCARFSNQVKAYLEHPETMILF